MNMLSHALKVLAPQINFHMIYMAYENISYFKDLDIHCFEAWINIKYGKSKGKLLSVFKINDKYLKIKHDNLPHIFSVSKER